MKLNLLSTWTRQKILTLFLVTFFQTREVKAGQSFQKCLSVNFGNTSYWIAEDGIIKIRVFDDDLYNALLKFTLLFLAILR